MKKHAFRSIANFFIGAGTLCFSGCRENTKPQEPVTLENLPADAVIAEVNGFKLNKKRYDEEVSLREKLLALAEPVADNQMRSQAMAGICSGVLSRFIQTSLLLSGLDEFQKTNSLPNFAEAYESNRVANTSKYDAQFTANKYNGFESMSSALDDAHLQTLFATIRNDDIAAQTYIDTVYASNIFLDDATVELGLSNIAKYNAKAEAANIETFALATNTLARLKAGETFEALADAVSQDPDKEAGGDIGQCTETDFSEEEGYWNLVSSLYDGETSDVIETSVGWEIVKCIRHIAAEQSDSGEPAVHLARIYFRRAMLCRDDYTPEEFRDEMVEMRREQTMSTVLKELWGDARVAFPYGSAILPRTGWERMPGYPLKGTTKDKIIKSATNKVLGVDATNTEKEVSQ